MVLKNSKWDKRAKFEYLKKHNLLKKNKGEEIINRPKWSGKKESNVFRPVLEASDSEYDTEEDEAFLSQFFPQIGETELTKEQKKKIKLQLLLDLENQDAAKEENEVIDKEDIDGIYLGSEEQRFLDLENKLKDSTLEDYISTEIPTTGKSSRNRKLLRAKESNGLFEEYGINYADTVRKKDDYNDLAYIKQQNRKLDDISNEELIGFKVGESVLGVTDQNTKSQLKVLEGEDLEENKRRLEKANQEKLLRQIKNKFGASKAGKSHKVLEINNFNDQDTTQLENLNARLTKNTDNKVNSVEPLDDDLIELLGETGLGSDRSVEHANPTKSGDIDELLKSLEKDNTTASEYENTTRDLASSNTQFISKAKPCESDQAFLDDLLG